MNNLYKKVLSFVFAIFISLVMVLSVIFGFKPMIDSLYEDKDKLLNVRLSPDYLTDVFGSVENAFTNNLLFRKQYVDLYGGLQRITGKKIIWDSNPNKTIMLGSDNKLYPSGNIVKNFESNQKFDTKQLDSYAQSLISLGEHGKLHGAITIFAQAPARYDPALVKLPIPSNDQSIEMLDYLYSALKNEQIVTTINLQKRYKEVGLKFSDLFFTTDHHWNIKTAFWAFTEICNHLNESGFGINQSFYNIKNYNIDTLKSSFLGSIGSRTGGYFAGYDDFDLIYPKFPTDYTKEICYPQNLDISTGGSIISTGTYTKTIIDCFDQIKSGEVNISYGHYMSTDRSETRIINNLSATDKKILVIKDSFALPVAGFLTTCFNELRMLDLRYQQSKSVYQYIEDYKPDCILILYNPSFYSKTSFNFTKPVL